MDRLSVVRWWIAAVVVALGGATQAAAAADEGEQLAARTPAQVGEAAYGRLAKALREGGEQLGLFVRLTETAAALDWAGGEARSFTGNLRLLQIPSQETGDPADFFIVRALSGELYVLAVPGDGAALAKDSGSPYQNLAELVGKKVTLAGLVVDQQLGGHTYSFLQLSAPPERLLLDRLFFIAIIILLFLTMVGMGMTLTMADFALVFKKPTAMVLGPICQFGLLPLLAMAIGHLLGFYQSYPFIFLGLILISASPGGVTSNLMTYFAKGDVALSVSLTAVCTVLALLFTPMLLALYGSNIPDFSIPVAEVFRTMLVLVVIPLFVGMVVRWRAETFAKRAEKAFAIIGVFALLFLIVVGVLSNLDKFADTERYGLAFYSSVFLLTLAGMLVAAVLAKLVGIGNYQVRAVALECGLRNASLAMTIALLLQDQMGDFYSSMFVVSGIFGLWMYAAGALMIWLFPKWLPVREADLPQQPEVAEAGASH